MGIFYSENDIVHTKEDLEIRIKELKPTIVVSTVLLKKLRLLSAVLPATVMFSKVPAFFVFLPKNTLKYYNWVFKKLQDGNEIMIFTKK